MLDVCKRCHPCSDCAKISGSWTSSRLRDLLFPGLPIVTGILLNLGIGLLLRTRDPIVGDSQAVVAALILAPVTAFFAIDKTGFLQL